MKKTIPFLLSLNLIAFVSCQKELTFTSNIAPADTTITSPAYSYKIKTYTEDVTFAGTNTVVTFNIAYDANNKVISLISATSPGDKFIYQYTSNTSLTMDLYNLNVLSIHEILFLNSFLLPDSTFQYNDTNDSSTEKYFYNSSRQLVRLISYDYSIATGAVLSSTNIYIYDSEGNVVTETDGITTTTLDYFDIVNNLVVFPFSPVSPVKLIKTTTIQSNGTTSIIHHTYIFDSSNRVVSEKQLVEGGTEVVIKSYTYY